MLGMLWHKCGSNPKPHNSKFRFACIVFKNKKIKNLKHDGRLYHSKGFHEHKILWNVSQTQRRKNNSDSLLSMRRRPKCNGCILQLGNAGWRRAVMEPHIDLLWPFRCLWACSRRSGSGVPLRMWPSTVEQKTNKQINKIKKPKRPIVKIGPWNISTTPAQKSGIRNLKGCSFGCLIFKVYQMATFWLEERLKGVQKKKQKRTCPRKCPFPKTNTCIRLDLLVSLQLTQMQSPLGEQLHQMNWHESRPKNEKCQMKHWRGWSNFLWGFVFLSLAFKLLSYTPVYKKQSVAACGAVHVL